MMRNEDASTAVSLSWVNIPYRSHSHVHNYSVPFEIKSNLLFLGIASEDNVNHFLDLLGYAADKKPSSIHLVHMFLNLNEKSISLE
jgi:hypothetical protein